MPITHQRLITHHIHQVHIADGFADDCEELIHRWLKTETLTYQTFCEIWKDMQFDLLYHGRPTGAEMAELSEELLRIAKHYMVTNPDNFEESVAGLFLVYGLLNLQPYPGFASLRIVPEDVPAINCIEEVARASRRYDVLYILGSILIQGPVQYHAVVRERGMESSLRKYLDGTTGIDRIGVRPKGVFFRQNAELDLIRELNYITRRYTTAKRKMLGYKQSLNYINENIGTELDSSLKEIINGILEEGDAGNQKISDHYLKVQAIKEKAMRQTVDGVKFLSSAGDRNIEANRPMAMSMSTKPVKKSASPRRKQSTEKRRCTVRANTYKYRNRKRRGRTKYSSSSSSSDTVEMSSDDTQDDTPYDTEDSQDNSDVELDNVKKSPTKIQEKEINIQIERLPVLIRTEQDGKMLEIEFVDEMVKDAKAEKKSTSLKELFDKAHGEGFKNSDLENMAEITKIQKDVENLNEKGKERKKKRKIFIKPNEQLLGLPPVEKFDDNLPISSRKRSYNS